MLQKLVIQNSFLIWHFFKRDFESLLYYLNLQF